MARGLSAESLRARPDHASATASAPPGRGWRVASRHPHRRKGRRAVASSTIVTHSEARWLRDTQGGDPSATNRGARLASSADATEGSSSHSPRVTGAPRSESGSVARSPAGGRGPAGRSGRPRGTRCGPRRLARLAGPRPAPRRRAVRRRGTRRRPSRWTSAPRSGRGAAQFRQDALAARLGRHEAGELLEASRGGGSGRGLRRGAGQVVAGQSGAGAAAAGRDAASATARARRSADDAAAKRGTPSSHHLRRPSLLATFDRRAFAAGG